MAKLSGGWSVKSDAGVTHAKAAKVFLDGSCRCICVEVLYRAVLERRRVALIWTHATFNEAVGALPVCRANDPRSLSTCDWRRCLFKPALLSHSMKWQKRGF